jgi:hypothetical protein
MDIFSSSLPEPESSDAESRGVMRGAQITFKIVRSFEW